MVFDISPDNRLDALAYLEGRDLESVLRLTHATQITVSNRNSGSVRIVGECTIAKDQACVLLGETKVSF